ncbi:unnamed protein product, partial [Amoebophrya sp. A120]
QENPIPDESKEKKDNAGNAWFPASQFMIDYNEQKHTDILGALRNAYFEPDKGDSSIYSYELEPHDPRPAWLEGMEMRTKQVPAEVQIITDSQGRTRTIQGTRYGLHRKAHLRKLPEILRLEVNRFTYENNGSTRKKMHYLEAPRLFYIDGEASRNGPSGIHTEFQRARLRNPHCPGETTAYTEWARQTRRRGMDPVSQLYELHAVILHHGPTPNCGHYTAVVNIGTAQQSPRWRHFDDQLVTEVLTTSVVGPSGILDKYLRERAGEGKTINMLLYKKKKPDAASPPYQGAALIGPSGSENGDPFV